MTATGTAKDNQTGIRVVQFFDQTTSPPTYLFDGTLTPYPCNAGVNCSWTTTVSFPSRFKAGDLYTFRIKIFDRADPVFPYTNANIQEYFRTICLSGPEILNDGIDQDCNGSDLVDRAAPSVTIDSITVNGNPVSGIVGYNDRIVVSGRAIDPSSDPATGTNTATGIGVIQVFDATQADPTPNTYLFDASKSCSTAADCNWQFTLQFPGSYSTGTHYTFKVKVFDKVNPTFPYDGSNIGYAWGTLCLSGTEVCNGVDDNCNGQTDEGLGTLSCGIGACSSTVNACVNGVTQVCTPGAPSTEVCDAVDNNCNGSIDENLSRQTTCGVGACASNTGTETCTTGNWGGNTCNPTSGATAEVCNNVDDDCDGNTDESLTRQTTCGVGACANNTGAETCTTGAWGGNT